MVGICQVTKSHHNHRGQKPTMVGFCHGGNVPISHDDDDDDDDDYDDDDDDDDDDDGWMYGWMDGWMDGLDGWILLGSLVPLEHLRC